ncbi:NAD(P)H-dependent oxidoreductase [Streptomyces sp. NPDC004787]|uniref:NAD(P)H-dependent oxidoreductase n=1 Tax=Streptomyces sp. NPDC004787 TaxID=3154291 RepID=UPI0033B5D28A
MKTLVVTAHPDPRSLTHSLQDVAVRTLREQGHEVEISDLYAMKWKSEADFDDFADFAGHEEGTGPDGRPGPDFMRASGEAFASGRLGEDIRAEQRKLLAADLVLLHYPLWWFTMPAILKGWFDRVFTAGFAYGPGLPRYGEGPFTGKRAMVVTTTGGRESNYTARGVNGPMDDLLFPVNHGLLWFTGFQVLPPFVAHRAVDLTEERFAEIADRYRERLAGIETAEPLPYRPERGGDYDAGLQLRPGREAAGTTGFDLHRIHREDRG